VTTGLLTPTHVATLLIIMLLILGPRRLPQAGRALGGGIREFKDAIKGRDDGHSQTQAPAVTAPTAVRQEEPPAPPTS
jgi:sec-independent protein translocase protein TatA